MKKNLTLFTGSSFRNTYALIRILDHTMMHSEIEIQFEIESIETLSTEDHINTMNKIQYWLDAILNNSIAINVESDIEMETLGCLSNNIIFCPDEPTDIMLLMLLSSKLNAICDGNILIHNIELTSDISNGFSTWVEGDTSAMLPTNTEWVGERQFYTKPWWSRSDGSTIDMWAADEDDLNEKPDILEDLDFINKPIKVNSEPAEIIKPNFKPVVITNDKFSE